MSIVEHIVKHIVFFFQENNYKTEAVGSCFPSGANVNLGADQIFDSPCANGLLFNYTYNFTVNSSRIKRVKREKLNYFKDIHRYILLCA